LGERNKLTKEQKNICCFAGTDVNYEFFYRTPSGGEFRFISKLTNRWRLIKLLDVNRLKSKKVEGRIREGTKSIIFHTKFAFLMILT